MINANALMIAAVMVIARLARNITKKPAQKLTAVKETLIN